MIGSGARCAWHEVFSLLFSTDEAVSSPSGLVDALVAVPVAVWHGGHGRLEAVRVVTLLEKCIYVKKLYNLKEITRKTFIVSYLNAISPIFEVF